MFVGQLILLAAIAALGAAEVPSYIQVCGLRNPNFNDCVIKSVTALTGKLRKGIPELDIPSVEPLYIEKLILADLPNFKVSGKDVKLGGVSSYKINAVNLNLEKKQIDLDLQFAENTIDAICDVTAKILVPIAGRGPFHMTAKDVNAKIQVNYKLVQRNGKRYFYFTSMTTRLKVKDSVLHFKAENFDETLQTALNQAMTDSRQEVISASTPHIERAISELCLRLCNNIAKHFSFDELLPDRE